MGKHRTVGTALRIQACLCAAIGLAGCSGSSTEIADAVLRPAAGKEPGGLQAQLEVELERAMLEAGRTKRSSAPPTGVANRVNDLTLSAGSDGFLLEWTYVNDADYDRNGVVSISDLTPIGLGFGKQNSDPAWENFRVADGDGNGEINLADVTPVGRNFGNNISHWMLQNSFTGTSGWVDNGMLEPELPQARIGIVLHEPLEQWYRIVPVDAEGFRGEPSNATRLDVNGPTVVAVSGNSGLSGSQRVIMPSLFGGEPASWLWDFGGGAEPASSTERSPQVTLGAPGSYQCSVLTGDGSGTQNSFAFKLNVSAKGSGGWPVYGADMARSFQTESIGPASPSLEWQRYTDSYSFGQPVFGVENYAMAYTRRGIPRRLGVNFLMHNSQQEDFSEGVEYANPQLGSKLVAGPDDLQASNCTGVPLVYAEGRSVVGLQDGSIRGELSYVEGPNFVKSFGWEDIWTYQSQAPIHGSGVLIHYQNSELCVFGNEQGWLVCLDTLDGAEQWVHNAGGPLLADLATRFDRNTYAGTTNGRVLAVDIEGNELWSTEIGGVIVSLSAEAGMLHAARQDGSVVRLSLDGSVVWTWPGQRPLATRPLVLDGTFVCVCDTGGWLTALDGSGGIFWQEYIGCGDFMEPVRNSDGNILSGGLDGVLRCHEPGGELLWSRQLPQAISTPPGVDNAGYIHVICDDGFYRTFSPGGEAEGFANLRRPSRPYLVCDHDGNAIVQAEGLRSYSSQGIELWQFHDPRSGELSHFSVLDANRLACSAVQDNVEPAAQARTWILDLQQGSLLDRLRLSDYVDDPLVPGADCGFGHLTPHPGGGYIAAAQQASGLLRLDGQLSPLWNYSAAPWPRAVESVALDAGGNAYYIRSAADPGDPGTEQWVLSMVTPDGDELWHSDPAQYIQYAELELEPDPVQLCADGSVLVFAEDTQLRFMPQQGIEWVRDPQQHPSNSFQYWICSGSGRLFGFDYRDYICLDLAGNELWRHASFNDDGELGGSLAGHPVMDGNGDIYLVERTGSGTNSGLSLLSMDADGGLRWSLPLGGMRNKDTELLIDQQGALLVRTDGWLLRITEN